MSKVINKIKEIICKINNVLEGDRNKDIKYICITKEDAELLSTIEEKYNINFNVKYKNKKVKLYTSL